MYNTSFLCTYQLMKEYDLSDDLYRCQFLQACNLNEWDGDTINKMIEYLESITENDDTFKKALSFPSIQNQFLFLLAYPYFHLTHRCICDTILEGNVTDTHRDMLFNEIMKNNT
jgi:hypothetical protein